MPEAATKEQILGKILDAKMFKHWGCVRSCQGAHPGQLIPIDKKVIPYHMALCPVVKTQGEKEEAQTCELYH